MTTSRRHVYLEVKEKLIKDGYEFPSDATPVVLKRLDVSDKKFKKIVANGEYCLIEPIFFPYNILAKRHFSNNFKKVFQILWEQQQQLKETSMFLLYS